MSLYSNRLMRKENIAVKILFIILCLMILSCNEAPTTVSGAVLDEPFELKVNEAKQIHSKNLTIGFGSVDYDSRCPDGAICVWEGEANVNLWLSKPSYDTVKFKLTISGYVIKADTSHHRFVDVPGYRIRLMQLAPYPSVQVTNDYSKYIATLFIEEKN